MHWTKRYTHWLETHGATPAYGGWVILGLTACFWLAAANTLAGWLYVLSGTCLALLAAAAGLPIQVLKGIRAERSPLYPVSVGETLSLTVKLTRSNAKSNIVLQCNDQIPPSFDAVPWHTVEWPAKQSEYRWNYGVIPQQRGQYHWPAIELKTQAPLGLFSSQRQRPCPATVLVYPEIIPLSHCPILDEFAAANAQIPDQHHANQLGLEGTTRSIRPYRHGDARRLIHWRSSAKFNELRTRELEVIAGDTPVIIALNSRDRWHPESFESAVIAAASLYHYAEQQGLSVKFWSAGAGLQQHDIPILETLATINPQEEHNVDLPNSSILWLTESFSSNSLLPTGSHIILWQHPTHKQAEPTSFLEQQAALVINPIQELGSQLQQTLFGYREATIANPTQ